MESQQIDTGVHIGGYRPSVLSRPSQGVTLIAVTRVRDATAAEVAVIADPVLSQGGQRNTSARQRCRIVLTERCPYVTKQRRR